jgi:hypothetical protein
METSPLLTFKAWPGAADSVVYNNAVLRGGVRCETVVRFRS